METRKVISDVLEGETRALTFNLSVALGPGKDVSASILLAFNFARLAFAAEHSTPVLSNILRSLCSGEIVENALAICREWPGDIHLEVEDVCCVPLFEMPLKLMSTDYDSPHPDRIVTQLEHLRTFRSSAAILISRYPDIITCLRLHASTDVFVLFNPRAALERERLASLTFSTSLPEIARCVCEIFPLCKAHLTQGNLRWQGKPPEKCAGHVFVPRTTDGSRIEEESLIMSSLTLLTLKAELDELTRKNGDLKRKKQALDRSVADLEVQLEEAKIKTRRAQLSKPSIVNATGSAFFSLSQGPQSTKSSRSTGKHKDTLDDEIQMDPSEVFARQLQATFDSENDLLLQQKHELAQIAQRHYHCGVCLDDFPEDDVVCIELCGHEICRDCTRGHTCTKIEEHRFPVLCPVCMADSRNKNPGTISGALVQLLGVSEKQWETWVEMEIAQFSILIDCRRCHHSGFVDRQDLDASSEIHCPFPGCNHVWCKRCQQTIEQGGPKHSCDGASELDHLMKQQGWRYCPNCKTPVQKSHGCNHLSCIAPGCNTHFCYGCGKMINRTAIPHEIQQGKAAHFAHCSLH